MKFSVNWLREFVDLPKDAEEIAELLALSPSTVEREWSFARAWLYDAIAAHPA